MIETLQLVHGAVGDKTLLDIMTTFHIYDGRIQGMNGRVAIDAECPELEGLSATVDADRFMRAVEACDGEPNIEFDNETKHLVVKRKRFKAKMLLKDSAAFPRCELDTGDELKIGDGFIDVLTHLRPFISTDASRPWSMAVLFSRGYAYATNNVVLLRMKIGFKHDRPLLVPVFAIDELLRIKYPPRSVRICEGALYFMYPAWWLRAQLIMGQWPDAEALFAAHTWGRKMWEITEEFKESVVKIADFVPDHKYPIVKMSADGIRTLEGEYYAEVEGFKLPDAAFRVEPLKLMMTEATHANFSLYPKPCPWEGEGIEGFIIGVRV